MEKKTLGRAEWRTLAVAAIVFVIGLLFGCSMSYGIRGLSVLIGGSICVTGLMFVINSIRLSKSVLHMNGLFGSVLIAFGVMFIVNQMASIIIGFIPWGMIALGSNILLDSFLIKFWKKTATILRFVIGLVLGAAILILGICLKTVPGFMSYASMVLGIVITVYAVLMITSVFTQKNVEE